MSDDNLVKEFAEDGAAHARGALDVPRQPLAVPEPPAVEGRDGQDPQWPKRPDAIYTVRLDLLPNSVAAEMAPTSPQSIAAQTQALLESLSPQELERIGIAAVRLCYGQQQPQADELDDVVGRFDRLLMKLTQLRNSWSTYRSG